MNEKEERLTIDLLLLIFVFFLSSKDVKSFMEIQRKNYRKQDMK